ncbi:MAG: uncharacterized protein QOI04_1047 [Verrucomicrobiota bacterium]|jgi:uncharacterized protein YcgI (DUF1989 family)
MSIQKTPQAGVHLRIEAQSGTAFELRRGQLLRVIDLEGEQVADLVAFNRADKYEWLSSGRSIDYANKIYLTTGDVLYSNRSRPMFTIAADEVGRHDFLLTPCSTETFKIIYRNEKYHPSCFENLAKNLALFDIPPDSIPTTFNIFMNVEIDAKGVMSILPPRSKAGDAITLRAEMDLIVGLTACSAEMSNNYKFKPIGYEIA